MALPPYLPQLDPFPNRILSLLNPTISPAQLHQILAQILHHKLHSNTSIFFHFVTACQSLHLLTSALRLFHHLPRRPHVFSCNALIKSFAHSNQPHVSFLVYDYMHRDSVRPNNYTFPFVLKSLSDLGLLRHGQSVHIHVLKTGHGKDLYVQNSLMDLYASCGIMRDCQLVFDEMPQRDAVTWTTLISGHRNARNFEEALIAFERMQFSGVAPNRVTMVNVLAACAGSGALEMGVWVHEFIQKSHWELDVILGTSLVDMYGKCGKVERGLSVFHEIVEKNVYTWNSLINGLGLAKNGTEAVLWFCRMEKEGIKPDEISLLGVLCACTHSGLVEIGRQIFKFMANGRYGISPGIKHYGCMVDLLGRAGMVEEAQVLIERMPFEPTRIMWGSLFASCRSHGKLELSEFAAKKLVELEPMNSAYYVILSNIYAQMGRWYDAEEVRFLMNRKGLKKDLGGSGLSADQMPTLACEL